MPLCFRKPKNIDATVAANNVGSRTAAAHRGSASGSRVIAVPLIGMLDDGVAKLQCVYRAGKTTLNRDSSDAEYQALPNHAMEAVDAAHMVPLHDINKLVNRHADEIAPAWKIPEYIKIEASFNVPQGSKAEDLWKVRRQQGLVCPDCGGLPCHVSEGEAAVFRRHVGHAMPINFLLPGRPEDTECSLWVGARQILLSLRRTRAFENVEIS